MAFPKAKPPDDCILWSFWKEQILLLRLSSNIEELKEHTQNIGCRSYQAYTIELWSISANQNQIKSRDIKYVSVSGCLHDGNTVYFWSWMLPYQIE